MSERERRKKRRRPGRFRRWIVRPAAWALILLALLVFVLVRFLESAAFAERVRVRVERELAEYLDREVEIGSLELDLVPLGVELSDFAVSGPTPETEPFLTVERVVVEAELGALVSRRVELAHLHLTRPRLWLGFDADGTSLAPRFDSGGGGGARAVEVRLGTIEVEEGEVVLEEERMPLDFAARGLEAVFTGVDEGVQLRGRAESDDFGLVLPPGRPYPGALEVHGVIRSHRFDIVRAELRGPSLAARVDGYWRWHGDREVALELEAEGDLEALGRLGYLDGQLAGPFDFGGSLTRKPGILLVDGTVQSPRARVFGRSLEALTASVQADSNLLSVDIDRSRYAAGDVGGRVTLGLALDPGRVDLDLELDGVPLGRLLSDQAIALEGLGGGVSGVFNYQFDSAEPEAGNGWADLVVADERSPTAGDVALSGTVPLVIGDGVVRSDAVRLGARGLLLTAAGSYDLKTATGSYDFDLTTEEVAEVVRLIPGGDEATPTAWRPTSGRGRALGSLAIGPTGTSVRLRLDLVAVEAPGYRADELSGVVAVDGAGVRELRLELTRPDAALIVDAALPFEEPAPDLDPIALTLAIDAAGWPLEEARIWLPFELPLEGRYSGGLELGADPDAALGELAGRIEGRLAPARWGELAADSLAVSAAFDAEEIRFRSADLAVSGGVVSASGALGREDLGLDLAFDSTPLALDQGQLASRLGVAVAGSLVAGGTVGGTLAEPELGARLEWSELRLGAAVASPAEPGEEDETATEASVDLDWRGGRLDLSGSLLGLAAIEGGGELSPDRVALEFALADGELGRAVRLAVPEAPVEGSFAGRVTVSGSYSPGVELETRIVLDEVVALPARSDRPADAVPVVGATPGEGPTLRLANLEPVVVEIGGEGVRIRSLYLGDVDGGSEIFVGGTVGGGGGFDLQLQTSIASEWLGLALTRFWPEARWSGGSFDAIATIEGTTERPRISGVGEVRDARLVAEVLPTAVEDLSGTFLFYRDQLVLDSATARLAGGEVRLGGSVSLAAEDLGAYRFQAAGQRLSYRSELGWVARGSAEVTLASTADGRLLSGVVSLDQADYLDDVKVGLDQLLGSAFGNQRLEVVPAADELRASTQLSLRVEGDRALRVRNNLADLRGSTDLVVRGSLARPVVFGTVEVEPGGRLEYAGADYRVERGQLTFTNPYRIEPVVDLAARTQLREYDVTLNLAGTPDRLTIDLASNPPLADLDVLALLTGASEAPLGSVDPAGGSGGAGVGAESFLYGQATSLIAQRFNLLFGLDKFRIDPLTSSTGDLSSARVTVGKQLSRDLSVTYSYDPSATDEQVLEIEWNVSRSLILVLTQNGDGSYALDARWEKAL